MAGHSKWANIKHRKGAQDAKRGNLFSKIAKDITVAAKNGGADPSANIRLRALVDKARSCNMPKDNIERAIKKGTGELEGVQYEELSYEGYGPGGVAIIIDVTTDSRNRASADIRKIFSKFSATLGEAGCVSWMFEIKGYLVFELQDPDDFAERVMDLGVDDIEINGTVVEIYTIFDQYASVLDAINKIGFSPVNSEISKIPNTKVALDTKQTEQFLKLLDALESYDDVSNIFTNADLDAKAVEKFLNS